MALKLAILASGEGTTFQSIAEHIEAGVLRGVEIALLICNRKGAGVLRRAAERGVPHVLIPHRYEGGEKKPVEVFESEVLRELESSGAGLVFLAGWDRIISPRIIDAYPNRIMNLHPSLLPAFAGLYGEEVHRAVINHGCKVSGCTIHYVDYGVDTGPIILQQAVPVMEDDTPETLAERIKTWERRLVPMAIQLHADGRIQLVRRGGRLVTQIDYSGGWRERWEERQSILLGGGIPR